MTTQNIPQLTCETREKLGSRYAQRLRKQGRVPAVVYGHGEQPVHTHVSYDTLIDILHDHAHLVEAVIDGQNAPCLIKDVQWNYLGSKIVHVDLARVDLSEEVEVEVDIQFVGEPKALQQAGTMLEHPLTILTIKCRADQIPEAIEVDIENLTPDEPLTIADLTLPEGIVAVDDPETLVVHIVEVRQTEEEEEAVADEAAEPELIGKKKEDDTDENEKE